MAYNGLSAFAERLEREGELVRISGFADPVLEITEITDRMSKLPGGGKALLFEQTGSSFPLLINALGSERRMALAFGRGSLDEIGGEIGSLFRELAAPKAGWWEKLAMLPRLRDVASWMPRRVRGRGRCQEVVMETPDLGRLPVLQCWPADGGRFITLPAVHTLDPETGAPNAGMYRMQLFGPAMTGMHWHRHKTGARHFEKYKTLGRRMPVTVTLGGDPAYIYAATAPMPENMDEYLLAGFLRKKQVRLVKSLTNELWIPEDADFVIEGYVDPAEELVWEGPFGDHTGFYSLADFYPRFHVTCITHRRDAVYPATIVGVPPMEDAWIGKATGRIFTAPIRLTMIPELDDMELPFAGVAHNLSLVTIQKRYPGQAVKVMNSLWGAGQMMFNKILVVADSDGGLQDHPRMVDAFLRWFDPDHSLYFSRGPLDVLDHSSQVWAYGSKVGIDLTAPLPGERPDAGEEPQRGLPVSAETIRDVDPAVFRAVEGVADAATLPGSALNSGGEPLPVLLLAVDKQPGYSRGKLTGMLAAVPETAAFRVVLLFDRGAPLDDLFTLVWLLGGNLEPHRDIVVVPVSGGPKVVVADATIKTAEHDHFGREWPNIVTMDDATIARVDGLWSTLGLGEFLPSPSLKFKPLVRGMGAVREP
jgi:4-hydroxy-3-polyprenylbenzoate decarboxylase